MGFGYDDRRPKWQNNNRHRGGGRNYQGKSNRYHGSSNQNYNNGAPPNSNYKGNNYDPDYHKKKRNNRGGNYRGRNSNNYSRNDGYSNRNNNYGNRNRYHDSGNDRHYDNHYQNDRNNYNDNYQGNRNYNNHNNNYRKNKNQYRDNYYEDDSNLQGYNQNQGTSSWGKPVGHSFSGKPTFGQFPKSTFGSKKRTIVFSETRGANKPGGQFQGGGYAEEMKGLADDQKRKVQTIFGKTLEVKNNFLVTEFGHYGMVCDYNN